jgi:hypothetical protein
LGAVNTNKPGYLTGSSAPQFFQTPEGLKLITGSEEKGLLLYDASQRLNSFPVLSSELSILKNGFQVKPALADINNDGFYELIVGNARGGLQLYATPWRKSLVSNIGNEPDISKKINIYPNPANDFIRVDIDLSSDVYTGNLSIIDGLGRILLVINNYIFGEQVPISNLPKGYYFVRLESKKASWQAPFIK